MNDTRLQHYYQSLQTHSGWFPLIQVMIDGMIENAGDEQSRPFLRQMGNLLGERFPLPVTRTVGELEKAINRQFIDFSWGYIDLEPYENALLIRHMALPTPSVETQQATFCQAFAAVLEGLYARWLQDQGGKSHVSLWHEKTQSATEIHFRYQNSR